MDGRVEGGFCCCPFQGSGSAVVYSLFIVAPVVCGGLVSFLVLQSSRWVALLLWYSECHVSFVALCLFLAMP